MGSCWARSVYRTTRLLGRLSPLSLTSIVHILSPETDNCPSWISGRERMTVENISLSISTKECCRPRQGWTCNLLVSSRTAHPTEPPRSADYSSWSLFYSVCFIHALHHFHQSFSHIMWQCLNVAGSSMLTFRELPYWNHAPDKTRHDILSSHIIWTPGWPVLALLFYCWVPSNGAASIVFKLFGMTHPGIEPL